MIYPVILCGGSGSRLWPSSRQAYPKQFAALVGNDSLYQSTLKRLTGPLFAQHWVMTNDAFRFMATDQARDIGLTDARVVVEPALRDTAPAVLTAALMLMNEDAEAVMMIAPSDHLISDTAAFLEAVEVAYKAVQDGNALVTFGVTPDRPETGYGYLELSTVPDGVAAIPLASFHEKPDVDTAKKMLAAGSYLWNAGIFLFRARDVVTAFETYSEELMGPCKAAIEQGKEDLGFFRLDKESYSAADAISFDYAVMERADNVISVPLDCGWTDLGSWDALWQVSERNEAGVSTYGPSTAVDCHDTYLRSEETALQLVGLGLDGVIAVAMRDAVLVADKSRAQDVKKVVEILRAAEVDQANHYPRFHRPWGWYETLCMDSRFQVKRIMVNPGGVLSLQSHMHRSEHWVVVSGTAEVTIGEETKLVSENESVYIPLGTVHRMANPGKLPMYLIEVQTGSYLGEDDIIRYEDIYNRN